jgi:uncharacterized protein YccT (UPF0319 family)
MSDFDDLIAYENEHTYLDFKAIQYTKEKHEDLLKDLIAIANAAGNQDRHIILGVNYKNNGERDIVGIKDEDFIDSAQYQQLAYENIEPKINFDYFAYNFKGDTIGILKISDCNDKPYMMKKDYNGLNKGNAFIRRGDSQDRLTRSDLDKISEARKQKNELSDKILIGFDGKDFSQTLKIPYLASFKLPSQKARDKIESILEEKKEKLRKKEEKLHSSNLSATQKSLLELQNHNLLEKSALYNASNIIGRTPLEDRPIKELKEDLKKVEETYKADNDHEIFEIRSEKINFTILNKGESYLEDTLVKVFFPNKNNFIVAEKIFQKPSKANLLIGLGTGYPDVKKYEDKTVVSSQIGNLKHHLPQTIFAEPLRVVANKELLDSSINIEVKIFAKNLENALEFKFKIEIVEQN